VGRGGDRWRPFLPGALAFLPGVTLPLETWWPAYLLGVTGVLTWTISSPPRRAAAIGRRRARRALEQTSLEDATLPRLGAARPHPPAHGSASEDATLPRLGAAVDAGPDLGRHLVEITPVGVRVMSELRQR